MLQGVTWFNRVLHGFTGCYTVFHGVTRCYRVLHGVTLCQDPISRPLSAAVRKDRQTTLCLCGRFCYCNLSIGLDKIDEIQMDIAAATIHSKLQISTNNF